MASPEAEVDTKETGAKFYKHFTGEVSTLQQQIDNLSELSTSGPERASAIDKCLADISKLASEVKDASPYLPGYDQRMYTESLKSLSTRLATARASFAPKPKFSFKSSRKQVPAPASEDCLGETSNGSSTASDTTTSLAGAIGTNQVLLPKDYEDLKGSTRAICDPSSVSNASNDARTLSNLKNGVIVWSSPTSTDTSTSSSVAPAPTTATLSHIRHSIINLCQPPAPSLTSLTLHHITSTLIIAPPRISGPIHITHISNSIILIPFARQFRMHHCDNVSVYLNVGSRPVVEGVNDVGFAPAPRGLMVDEGLIDEARNLWDQVDDFNWLRREQSPHWKLVTVEERLGDDVWRRVIGGEMEGKQDDGVDDVLKGVGLIW